MGFRAKSPGRVMAEFSELQDRYGIGDFASSMRQKLGALTLAEVNAAIRKHLSARNLSVVIVTKDAENLKQKLLSDEFSPLQYDGEKPKELLEEDKAIVEAQMPERGAVLHLNSAASFGVKSLLTNSCT